ncbi:MAG: hypothetical protein K6G06_08875 [Butyrivibrio sp.]|nr:hypothetical protein [Butyrivibrio sp.]
MEKKIRDTIKRIDKIELELLSDEEIAAEKEDVKIIIDALQRDMTRRMIIIGCFIVSLAVSVVGLLAYPSAPMLFVPLLFALLMIMAVVQYLQKRKFLEELYGLKIFH